MRVLSVDLGDRSYPIYIGSNILRDAPLLCRHIRATQVLVVTNETIAPLYLDGIVHALSSLKVSVVVLPDGEKHKNLTVINQIFDKLMQDTHSRTTTLLALGGGVIGDMTGFAAACYQRGVRFVQVPTTLLSQVDSSVGGKTGVNHPLGKNMIGAFHQPSAVFIDVSTLDTLPAREFSAGLAEVIKYALLGDHNFYQWLDTNLEGLLSRQTDLLEEAIARSCANKAAIVAADETENGVRALLNLGHTFGHAIEAWQSYADWLHGEAVSVGMVIAAELSCAMGMLSRADVDAVRTMLARAKLPVYVPEGMTSEDFIHYMQRDKKVMDGRLRLILLQAIGNAVISDVARPDQIVAAIDACRQPGIYSGGMS